MSSASFTFSPLAFGPAALVRPSPPTLPQGSFSLSLSLSVVRTPQRPACYRTGLCLWLLVAGWPTSPEVQHWPRSHHRTHCLCSLTAMASAVSRKEMISMLNSLGVAACAVQESKLTATSSSPSTPGYTFVRRDCLGGGDWGGLAFFIRQDVYFTYLDTNQFFPLFHFSSFSLVIRILRCENFKLGVREGRAAILIATGVGSVWNRRLPSPEGCSARLRVVWGPGRDRLGQDEAGG